MKEAKSSLLAPALLGSIVLAIGAAGLASAQTPPPKPVATPANVLSLGDIESRLVAQGVKSRQIEVRDLLLEVEGYDAAARKIELVIDRPGERLSHSSIIEPIRRPETQGPLRTPTARCHVCPGTGSGHAPDAGSRGSTRIYLLPG